MVPLWLGSMLLVLSLPKLQSKRRLFGQCWDRNTSTVFCHSHFHLSLYSFIYAFTLPHLFAHLYLHLQPITHSLTHLFIYAYMCAFIQSVYSVICSFIHLFTHIFIHSFIPVFVHLFLHSFICWCIHLFSAYSLLLSFIHFIRSVSQSFIDSFIALFRCPLLFVYSLSCSYTYAIIHEFIRIAYVPTFELFRAGHPLEASGCHTSWS